MSTILIAGGYGVVGSAIARHIRFVNPHARIVLAGRNPERGRALAAELGNASVIGLDLDKPLPSMNWGQFDLIIAAMQDPGDTLIRVALDYGIAHIGITKLADEVAPLLSSVLSKPPARPIVPLGHSQSGVLTLAANRKAFL